MRGGGWGGVCVRGGMGRYLCEGRDGQVIV